MRVKLFVLFLVCLFVMPSAAADTNEHWAAHQIAEIQAQGIMTGDGSGFKPDCNITRAEFVCAVIRAINAKPTGSASGFSDVSKNSFYAPYIKTAVTLGIVTGFSDGTFRPESSITRQDAIVVLSRAFGYLSGYSLGRGFLDYDELSQGARAAVGYALNEKIISGYPDNTLKPRGTLTRAEAACLILRSMAIEKTKPGFIIGYPKLSEMGEFEKMRVELSTNMPCTVYYMLTESTVSGIPAQISVTTPLCKVYTAKERLTGEIKGELGMEYNIYLMAVTADGRRSNVVELEKVMPCPYTEGDGSKRSPYAIYNSNQLDAIRSFSDKNFILKSDIQLIDEWEPIAEFFGSLDGNGHRIEGLKIETDKSYQGLFGKIVKGEVKNLTVEGDVRARSNAGIFAGELLDAKITGCVAQGLVNAMSNMAGGIVGENFGIIENSLSGVYSVGANSYAGGIAGQNYGIIRNSISAAHTVSAGLSAGGIASLNMDGARIENCVSASIYVYDVILDNCGRVAANKNDGILKNNYAYSGMRTNSENGVNALDNDNGADISWDELICKEALCDLIGWNKGEWAGGTKTESYLIPYPKTAKEPKLAAGLLEYAPVRISRASEFLSIASNPDMHYILERDIYFAENIYWQAPEGSADEGFAGTFDGNGHTIHNLKIKRTKSGLGGLFGVLSGEVRDLRIENVTFLGGEIIGGIAAINNGNIKNCIIKNAVYTADEADAYIGGVCGYNYANVSNCSVSGNIQSDVKNIVAGGIAAHNEGFIDEVSFSGSIITRREQGIAETVAGGICGYNSGGMIYNAEANVRMTQRASTVYAGGVCAIQNGGELYKCFSEGSIICDGYGSAVSYAGGVCGLAASGILLHIYSKSDITQYTPRSYAGGICGFNEAAVLQNGYAELNILQEEPASEVTKTAYAGGICGFNEGGVIASTVALNKNISSFGTTARICAAGMADSMYSNYSVKMLINQAGEGNLGGSEISETMLGYDLFTKPIADGGRLGWSEEIWADGGRLPILK